jgi:hypothetical protein
MWGRDCWSAVRVPGPGDPAERSAQSGPLVGNVRSSTMAPVAPDEQGHGVSGGVGVDSNDTVILLGDGLHADLLSANGTVKCRPGRVRRQTCNESRPVVGQASDQAIRTSRAGVAAGRRGTHQLQSIRGPTQDLLACGAESLKSHDHNRGGTNSASQPQASQDEPYRLLTVPPESQPATRLIYELRVRRAPQERRHGRRSRDRDPQTRPRPSHPRPPIRLRDQAAAGSLFAATT